MPRVIFPAPGGERRELEVPLGQSLMEAAIDNGVVGIVAECGGACSCGTCHAYIADVWLDRLPPVSDMEDMMLNVVLDRRANSRLACQIEMTAALDSLELFVADNES